LICAGQGWRRSFGPCEKRSITRTWERNILHTEEERKTHCTGHILHRHRLPKHFTKGKIEANIEVAGRRGRRSKQLHNIKEKVGYRKFEEEALDRTLRKTQACGSVVRLQNE